MSDLKSLGNFRHPRSYVSQKWKQKLTHVFERLTSLRGYVIIYFRLDSHCVQRIILSSQSRRDTTPRTFILDSPFATTIRLPNHISSIPSPPALRVRTNSFCISSAIFPSIVIVNSEICAKYLRNVSNSV